MSQEDLVQRILNDPKLLSALADKVYERIRDDVIIKKIEELEKVVRAFQDEMARMREEFEKRFEANQHEMARMREEFEKRFEANQEENRKIWQELARMREEFEKRFEANQEENRKIWQEIKLLRIAFSSFTSRAGRHIEKTIMELYKEALKLHGVDPSKVKHGKITDEKGIVYKGRTYEVDFYETNDYVYLFEVKNFADEGAIEQLDIREKLFTSMYNKPVKKFLIANTIEAKVKREAEQRGITVIAGLVVK
ncbi:MAG: hypothetical protein ASUL_08559 [Candidatus Aramenus sulfurataquae]|nr:MAG: hypothetical protein ASUL_08559 [Candidatus Aramenus sulfurataquae]MCL7343915.1 DUF3782 domain-containing protein [Candidatus Aramenus sulfurataquae]